MMIVRIGNDVSFSWELVKDDQPVNLNGAIDMVVEVIHQGVQKSYPQNFTRSGNVLNFQFTASEQEYIGTYDVKVSYKKQNTLIEGGYESHVIDKVAAFKLVKHTYGANDSCSSIVLNGGVSSSNAPDFLSMYNIAKL